MTVSENDRQESKTVFEELYYGECRDLLKAYMRPFVAEWMAEPRRKLDEK
jgi:hypothetical protein